MAQRTRLKTAGSSLPSAHGLFLVAVHGLPVQRATLIPMTLPIAKGPGIRLVSLRGHLVEFIPRRRRRLIERIIRAMQAFRL